MDVSSVYIASPTIYPLIEILQVFWATGVPQVVALVIES